MHLLRSALHHLCLGFPSSWCPVVDAKCLAFECSAFFALNIRQRTLECTIRMLLAKGPRAWGSGVSTRLAGCACCWHIWKNCSSQPGKYVCFFLIPAAILLCCQHKSAQTPGEVWVSFLALCWSAHWMAICSCCLLLPSLHRQRSGICKHQPCSPTGVTITGQCRISFPSPFKSRSDTSELGNARAEVAGPAFIVDPLWWCPDPVFACLLAAFPSGWRPSYDSHGSDSS